MKVKPFSFVWEISESELLCEASYIIKSPFFYSEDGHNFKCNLTTYVAVNNINKSFGLCKVFFNIDSESDTEIDSNIELSVIDEARKKNILYDKTLKVLCTVSIFNEYDISNGHSNDDPKLSLSGFFNSSKFSDFTIIVDTVEIPVHKIVLSTRSSVFDAMFNSDVTETQSNTLKIDDFRLEVVKEMLRYIYTDIYLNKVDMVTEIYMIADKYDIIDLKKIAEKHLIKTTSVDNSCKYLVLADTYSNDTLKKYCLEFVAKNVKEVIKKNDWKKFVLEHPLLLESLFKMAFKIEE